MIFRPQHCCAPTCVLHLPEKYCNGVVKYTNIRYIPVSDNWYKYLWEEVGEV
jgi:hypothetical protein